MEEAARLLIIHIAMKSTEGWDAHRFNKMHAKLPNSVLVFC